MGWNTLRRKPAVLPGHSGKRLAASGLTSRKKSGRCFLHTCRKYKQITARTVKVIKRLPSGIGSQKSQSSCLVPYYQAAGLPYCSPPAREYPSPSAAYRRRDTDSRRRQVTKLPKPCPQYPPFTLENGRVRFFPIMGYRVAGAATHWLYVHWIVARTFEIILLTDR